MITDQDIYEYYVETDDWTSHHDLHTIIQGKHKHTNRDSYACGIVNDKMIVAGGSTDDDSDESNVEANGIDSWDNSHSESHRLRNGRHNPGHGVVNGEFYVFGGKNGGRLDSSRSGMTVQRHFLQWIKNSRLSQICS